MIALPLAALTAPALGASMALDPQVRVHAGASVIPGPSGVGVTGGFDSRLTRIVAIDLSAFASPIPLGEDLSLEGAEDFGDYQLLRHGVYASPGFRIPHAQPKSWAWDFFLRAGGGVIWLADARPGDDAGGSTAYDVNADIGGFGGADLLVRFGNVGVRASGRAWMYDAVQTYPIQTFFLVRPQFGIEGMVQW
ncbi:MAG: hypothetical protein ACOZNI_24175 [Myxococcota bacterium]